MNNQIFSEILEALKYLAKDRNNQCLIHLKQAAEMIKTEIIKESSEESKGCGCKEICILCLKRDILRYPMLAINILKDKKYLHTEYGLKEIEIKLKDTDKK